MFILILKTTRPSKTLALKIFKASNIEVVKDNNDRVDKIVINYLSSKS